MWPNHISERTEHGLPIQLELPSTGRMDITPTVVSMPSITIIYYYLHMYF